MLISEQQTVVVIAEGMEKNMTVSLKQTMLKCMMQERRRSEEKQ